MNVQKTNFSCLRDGLTIRGTEYRTEGNNKPIAIICHGFMANQSSVKQYARFFAEHGYAAYTFDFCGGCVLMGKSDGKTTEMSVFTEVQDLLSVIAYVCGLSYTDEDRILLMGCSQGGFVSAITAARLKDRIKKLVLLYPAFCIPDDARRGKMMFAKFDPHNPPDVIQCGPMKLGKCYVEAVINVDPYAEIEEYQKDVLLIHGTKDRIVDIEYAKRAVAAYQKTQRPILSYYEMEGAGHLFSKKQDCLAMEWMEKFI